ncbi:MAG TPA: FeoA family protein [Anaerolineae bacterium]|nr:FeoA family protein [Anaerolineae bacterium]
MMRLLSDLKPGQSGTVCKVAGDKALRRRMLDMGLVNGAEVRVKRVARRFSGCTSPAPSRWA